MYFRFVALLLVVVTCAVASASAFDVFMKMDGIDGDSPDPRRPGEMGVSNFSWGVTNTAQAASGLPTGKRQHKPFTFTKEVDKATPKLFQYCCQGKHIPTAVITLTRPNVQGERVPYMTITLEDVVITSYQINGGGVAESLPTESMSITYAKITYVYLPTKEESSDSWKAQR